MAAVHGGTLVLDVHRLVLGVLRTLGLAALPLRLVVLFRGIRMDLGLGFGVESGLGQLVLVAGLCQLVPLGLLQFLVLGPLPRLGWRRRLLSAWLGPTATATWRCDSAEKWSEPR